MVELGVTARKAPMASRKSSATAGQFVPSVGECDRVIDLDRALRLPGLVRNGGFHFLKSARKEDKCTNRLRSPPSKEDKTRLREFLLDSRKLQSFMSRGRSEVLKVQHHQVWTKQWQELCSLEESLSEYLSLIPVILLEELPAQDDVTVEEEGVLLLSLLEKEQELKKEDKSLKKRLSRPDIKMDVDQFKNALVTLNFQEQLLSIVPDVSGPRMPLPKIPEEKILEITSDYSSASGESTSTADSRHSPSSPNSRLELEKFCGDCSQRLTVKFDLDQVDSADSSKWVVFSCPKCKYDLCREAVISSAGGQSCVRKRGELSRRMSRAKDLRGHGSAEAEEHFSALARELFENVSEYYRKKLEVLSLRRQELQLSRPGAQALELVGFLKRLYSTAANGQELWMDMFARLVNTRPGIEEGDQQARQIHHWLQANQQIQRTYKACLRDLERERDKASELLEGLKDEFYQSRNRKLKLESEKEQQERHCLELKLLLEGLKKERAVKRKEEEEERKRQEILEWQRQRKRAQREKRRRADDKSKLREFRKKQAELESCRRLFLQRELRGIARKKREKALQDYIRVNFRRVCHEKRLEEAHLAKRTEKEDELAREARLESLRRFTRSKMALGARSAGERTALLPTQSFRERVRALAEDNKVRSEAKAKKVSLQSFGYTEDEILGDARLVVESILREKGLLGAHCHHTYAASQILSQVEPPTRPRPEMASQIILGEAT